MSRWCVPSALVTHSSALVSGRLVAHELTD